MYVSNIVLKNWRNFRSIDVPLQKRTFLVGPNASGKSNFLDAFRFLRDIASPGGGLQHSVLIRGGLSRIRCLAARRYPDVEIEVTLTDDSTDRPTEWKYAIGIKQQQSGHRLPILAHERVVKNGKKVLDRPDDDDKADTARLTQTHLEQINANKDFRDISTFFDAVTYLHLVPQLVRHPREFSGPGIAGDPFGRSFLERIAKTPDRTRKARLRQIEAALQIAVPQLKSLTDIIDTKEGGVPHLEAVYEHWRPNGARQRESDFSDGTLRLIGLFWSLLDTDSLLLLEEPELSLNSAIVGKLPALIHRAQRQRRRQVLISTHSADLLGDRGIGAEEVLLLTPSKEGTEVEPALKIADVKALLESGLTVAEAALPRTAPRNLKQLEMFQ